MNAALCYSRTVACTGSGAESRLGLVMREAMCRCIYRPHSQRLLNTGRAPGQDHASQ